MSPVYKHAAPLGLQKKGKRDRFPLAIHIALRWSESRGFLDLSCINPSLRTCRPAGASKKGKRENRADSRLLYTLRSAGAEAGIFSIYRASIQSYTHVAPLGLGLLDMSPVYKHAALLGLQRKENEKTGQIPACYTHCAPLERNLGFSRFIVHQSNPTHMSPVYKHAAPLGLQKKGKRENGADSRLLYTLRSAGVRRLDVLPSVDTSLLWSERQNRIASDRYVRNRRGEVSKSSGLGNPTPTNSTVWWCLGFLSVQSVESDESVIQTKRTCRPSGALVCLVYAAFYKHVAPLGLNAPVILLSSRLGNPTPRHPASLAHVPIFVPPGSHVAPLGLWCVWCMPRSINMSPLWG